MKITCKTKDTLPLKELKEFQGELKKRTSKDINKIITSIKKFGFATPFFVWQNDGVNNVLDGHGRLSALHQMEKDGEAIPPLPVVYVDCKDEATAKQLLLRITSQYGEMTAESVLDFMNGLDLEVEEVALPCGTLDLHFDTDEETENDDDVPEVQEETVSQLGEIYELGEHLLMCGSATEKEDVERLLNGETTDLVLTDPPYGIDVVGNNGKVGAGNLCENQVYEKIIGDDTTDTAEKSYKILKDFSDKLILWGGNYFTKFLDFSDSWLIWDKRRDMTSNNFADGEMAWCSFHTPVRIYHQIWNGMIREGEHEKRVHPTQKPTKMLSEIINDFSKENDIVLDVFGGSGSTLIACAMTNRKCRMMELSPHYCDVIRRRYTQWAKENGKPITSGCLE